MLDLDFAFLNILTANSSRFPYHKLFWGKNLLPFFLKPRLERLIDLYDLGAGANIKMPLAPENLSTLKPELQSFMLDRSWQLFNRMDLRTIAADRRLRFCLPWQEREEDLIFGDNFILALAVAVIENIISRRQMKKIIVVGKPPDFFNFIRKVWTYRLPVSLQNINPIDYEYTAHKMLYSDGIAVSNSYIQPHNWRPGDMVIVFGGEARLTDLNWEIPCFRFTDDTAGLAPELEMALARSGIEGYLYNLAPIIESCLLTKNRDKSLCQPEKFSEDKSFESLYELGEDLGLWEHFLDNGV